MKLYLVILAVIGLQSCTVVAIVDAAASTAITAGSLVVQGTGAVIGAAIPDGDDDDDD
ncbi:NF038104 family lipoprotein [bacterium]|nr:NF038104 family lipoprotein [bacterium]